jgi:protein involved in polysaccharide export with SLBB domain
MSAKAVCLTIVRGAACLALAAAAGCLTMPSRGSSAAPYRPVERRTTAMAAVVAAAAPAQPPGLATPDTLDAQQSSPLTRVLKKGDRLDVTLRANPPPENFPAVVDDSGNINLPLIGDVHVEGLSAGDAQKMIEQRYISDKIYKYITVIIVPPVSEYTVSGEVLRPDRYPLMRDLTLLQALSRAGRFTEFADPDKVKVIRRGKTYVFNFTLIQKGKDKDPIIEAGDIIDVPRSRW